MFISRNKFHTKMLMENVARYFVYAKPQKLQNHNHFHVFNRYDAPRKNADVCRVSTQRSRGKLPF